MSGEYNTYLQLVTSNKNFCAALKSEDYSLDFNLCLEFILLYLKTKLSIIEELDLNSKEMLLDILNNNNYTIEDNQLIYKNFIIDLETLVKIANRVHDYEPELPNNVIQFKPSNIVRINRPVKHGDVISFEDFRPKEKTYTERGTVYNITFNVDKETKPYIRETEKRFSSLMDHFYEYISTNRIGFLSQKDLSILVGLLDVFSLDYALTHDPHFMDDIFLPSNSIGIGVATYDYPEVKALEKQIEKKKAELIEIDHREQIIYYYSHLSENSYQQFESKKDLLSNEIMILLANLYQTRTQPNIFNPTLIKSLMESIKENHVEIQEKEKPRLKFFSIKDEETTFHCSIPLEVFQSLIPHEEIIQLKKK